MTMGAAKGSPPSTRKKRQRTRSKKKLRVNERVEVRSQEDGFLGSWHQGVVMACGHRKRCIKYDHILVEDSSESFIEHVDVPPAVDGDSNVVNLCQYRGSIRPLPPFYVIGPWDLPYGLCVDVYHMEAWWEGVIFDHNDGGEERTVFFPDLGDQMLVKLSTIRVTMTWNETTENWHVRGQWLFLAVIEEYEHKWPLPVSVKQMWYDLRERVDFGRIKEWTSTDRSAWQVLVLETILENLMVILKEVLPNLAISGKISSCLLDVTKINCGPQVATVSEGFIDSGANLTCPCAIIEPSKIGENNGLDIGSLCNNSSEIDVQLVQKGHDLNLLVEEADDNGSNMKLQDRLSKCSHKEPSLPTPQQLTAIESPHGHPKVLVAGIPPRLSVKMDVKPKDPTRGRHGNWQPAGPDLIHGAEAFPDAIALYIRGNGVKHNDSLVAGVRRHLLYLGWKIEFRVAKDDSFRFRYVSPAGKCYQSLVQVCLDLTGAIKETLSVLSDDTSNNFTATSNPHAYMLSDNLKEHQPSPAQSKEYPDKATPMLRPEPHENPSAGRRMTRFMDKKRKREIPSFSLKERSNNSLGSACKLDGKGIDKLSHQKNIISVSGKSKAKVSGSLTRGVRSREVGHETQRLRSRKRVKVAAALNLMENNPRTVISWLIEKKALLPGTRVYYHSKYNSRPIAQGCVDAEGITCDCCGNMFSLRTFGIHAANSDRKVASNIFLEDGRSLLDCQVKILHNINENDAAAWSETNWQKGENDSICSVCRYGGEIVLCDKCPSSFHQSCIGMLEIPDGEWFCPSCCCRICNQSKSGDRTGKCEDDSILTCDQCNSKYHFDCITDKGANKLCNLPRRNWYCSKKCEEIYIRLHKLIGKAIPVGKDNLTWTLLRSMAGDPKACDIDETTQIDCKLNLAVSVMHECFEDVNDPSIQGDMVENIIFSRGSKLNRLNFRGFYTVVLERNDDLISVATIRVHGDKVAEAPLVCTRLPYRRLGMCHLLMGELEKKLKELGIHKLILPAIPSVLDTWTTSFGFVMMTDSERLQFLGHTFLDFQDTVMCQKQLLKEPPVEPNLLAGNLLDACNDAGNNTDYSNDSEG